MEGTAGWGRYGAGGSVLVFGGLSRANWPVCVWRAHTDIESVLLVKTCLRSGVMIS